MSSSKLGSSKILVKTSSVVNSCDKIQAVLNRTSLSEQGSLDIFLCVRGRAGYCIQYIGASSRIENLPLQAFSLQHHAQ